MGAAVVVSPQLRLLQCSEPLAGTVLLGSAGILLEGAKMNEMGKQSGHSGRTSIPSFQHVHPPSGSAHGN